MAESKSLTIDKVGWHTRTPGNTEPRELIHERFRVIIRFLQSQKLTNRTILEDDSEIDDDTGIHSDDLNENGLLIMKRCYDKWLNKIDHGLDPNDTSLFEKALNSRGDRGRGRKGTE